MRQGCILSPVLFSFYIIDGLAEEVKKVGGARYADIIVSLCVTFRRWYSIDSWESPNDAEDVRCSL